MKNDACLLIKSNRHSKDSEKWEYIWSKEGQMYVSWVRGLVELIECSIYERSYDDEINFFFLELFINSRRFVVWCIE